MAIAVALAIVVTQPAPAQLPLLPKINLETFQLDRNLNDSVISACVRLDGRCIFELSDQKSSLSQRIKYTEERLNIMPSRLPKRSKMVLGKSDKKDKLLF